MRKILTISLILVAFSAFGQSTDSQLTAQANVIRNETNPGANTRARVANMYQSIIDSKFSRVDDTNLSLLNALADPGADRILFWDESGNTFTWLQVGSGIVITGNVISSTGGGGGGGTWGSITGTLSDQSDLQSELDAKQDLDGDLTAIASLNTNGFLARISESEDPPSPIPYALRTLQAGNGITVTNGDGVSGNPSISVNVGDNKHILYARGDTISYTDSLTWNYATKRLIIGDIDASGGNDFQGLHIKSSGNPEIRIEGNTPDLVFYDINGLNSGSIGVSEADNSLTRGMFFRTVVSGTNGVSDGWAVFRFGGAYNKIYVGSTEEKSWIQSGRSLNFRSGEGDGADASASPELTLDNGTFDIKTNNTLLTGTLEALDTVVHIVGRRHSDGELVLKNIYSEILDRVSVSTASGTIDLDTDGKKQRVFTGSSSFATAKNLTISNETSSTAAFVFTFEITNLAAVLTMETNVLMQDSRFDGDDWTATATGVYKMTGTYDGTNWLCEISANPYQ